jgi:serine phosphatase RsbU (regulator of sigma subunit)
LNGRQVVKLGDVKRADREDGIALPINRIVFVSFDDDSLQTIAVRFANQYYRALPNYLRSLYAEEGFLISIADSPATVDNLYCMLSANVPYMGIIIGILFALALSHLLIYLFHVRQKSGLLFSLFGFTLGLMLFINLKSIYIQDTWAFVATIFIQLSLLPLIFVFFAGYVYSVYYEKLPRRFYWFLGLSILISLFMLFSFSVKSANISVAVLTIIVFIDCLRLLYLLVKKKYDGAWIIAGGALGFIGLMLTNYFIVFTGLLTHFPLWFYLFVAYAGVTSLPIALSYYLARTFARTNIRLEEKLHEVELLSAKAIEHERHSAELLIQKEKESAKAIEAELRTQAAELQAKTAELQAQALEAENNRRANELDGARRLQLSMLPSRPPEFPGYEIAAFIKTASEVGGDYYDFIQKSEDELVLCIGDATGHGVRAGIMVTIAKSVFVSLAGKISLTQFPEALSNAIREMKLGNLFMCLLTGSLKGNQFSFVSAGMPQALVYRAASEQVETIGQKAMPLGAPGNFPHEENSITLASGDTLLLLSDGLIEMFNAEKEMFGVKRVREALAVAGRQSAQEITMALAAHITEWRNNQSLEDDVTLLVIKKV